MKITFIVLFVMVFGLSGWCQHTNKKSLHKKISHPIKPAVVQYVDDDEADSLKVVELDCDTLTSEMLKTKNVVANLHYPNIVTYKSDDEIYLAYQLSGKDRWISILTPFTIETNDIQCVNIDRKNKPEIIVKGEVSSYGAHGGITDYVIIILNIDDGPKQIFKVVYGGSAEMFGDDDHKTTLDTYKRNIKVSSQGIYLSTLSEASVTGNETNIRGGRYIMKNGAIKRAAN